MKYRLDSSFTYARLRQPQPWRRYVGLLLLAGVLFFGGNYVFGWFGPIFDVVAHPFLRVSTAAVAMADTTFLTRGGLVSQVQQLKAENENLKSKIILFEEDRRQLAELRDRYGFKPLVSTPILAKVISKPNQTPYDVIIIDTGSKNAPRIQVGQTAVVAGSLVIGQVVETGPWSSKVRLFSSGGIELPVLIGDKGLPGVAKGSGGGNFRLDLPRGVDIVVGEKIVATAFPQYVLGQIDRIDTDPNEPFQTIRFRLPVNFLELGWIELYD